MSVTGVILPKLGLTMDVGRLIGWLKQEGDRVEAGEILFEVETDKSTMEVESPVGGYVRRLLAAAGDDVPVAQVIAFITTTADEPLDVPTSTAPPPAAAPVAPTVPSSVAALPAPTASMGATGGERVIASPAARKRADELGVDLATLRPAKGGRISVEDVEAARPNAGTNAAATAMGGARLPLTRMRRSIAERMTHAFRDVPQFSISRDVDMSAARALRASAGVSYADVLISATARTLRDHPRLTMRYEPDGLVPGQGIHLGIAVALDDGLLVPVLRDADTKDLATIARDRATLQEGARTGKLPAASLTGALFSISNLGPQGVDRFTAIVNPPEAAILAVGRVRDQVIAKDGAAVIRPVVTLTLSVDHRVVDGAPAAEFLADLAGRLEVGTA